MTTDAAREAGLDARDLTRMIEAGELVRPFRGVYVPPDVLDDPARRAQALGAVLPPGAALARETAAWVHGIDVRPPERYRQPPTLEVVSASDLLSNPLRRSDVHAYIAELPPSDVVEVNGVSVTTPARTAVDLARYTERYMALAAVDMFAHAGLVTIEELTARARELKGFRGIARARSVFHLADPRAESAGESWCRLRLREAGLPMPVLQIPLVDEHGKEIYRLDMGYPGEKVAIEYDGIAYHFSEVAQGKRDSERQADIAQRWGWRVLSCHVGHIFGRRPVIEGAVAEALDLDITPVRRRWRPHLG